AQATAAPAAAAPSTAATAAPQVDVPELSPQDRATWARAHELVDKGEGAAAWETSKALLGRYPDVLTVQDFRCSLATKVFWFETARRECDRLMQPARQPR